MPRKGKSKPTGRKPGAQPGNKNALRHGFYAKAFTKDESARLDLNDEIDVLSEIALIRVCIDRLKEHLELTSKPDDNALKMLNTLSVMTQSISTLARTQYLITGRQGGILDDIEEAFAQIRMEHGI